MLDAGPVNAEVRGLADVKISRAWIGSICGLGPVELAIGSPLTVTPALVPSEGGVRDARITGIVGRVRGISANNVIGTAAIVADQRCLNRKSQSAIKTENERCANSHPTSQNIRLVGR